jgi:hypothetical protein
MGLFGLSGLQRTKNKERAYVALPPDLRPPGLARPGACGCGYGGASPAPAAPGLSRLSIVVITQGNITYYPQVIGYCTSTAIRHSTRCFSPNWLERPYWPSGGACHMQDARHVSVSVVRFAPRALPRALPCVGAGPSRPRPYFAVFVLPRPLVIMLVGWQPHVP